MAGLTPVIREIRDAVLNGLTHLKNKLHKILDNNADNTHTTHTEVHGIERFDGASNSGYVTGLYRPDSNHKPTSMSDNEYFSILESSVHNPTGVEAVLGKFHVSGTTSYIDVAESAVPPATYFSLGDEWRSIADAHGLTDESMFEAFNIPFLERMMAERKNIRFSHNPLDFPGSSLASELDFLQRNGYVFDPRTMQAFLP